MADFPAVTPDASRGLIPGSFGVSTYALADGPQVRFLGAITATGDQLQLTFTQCSEADAELIREHYNDQAGGLLGFALSDEVLSGFAAGDTLAAAGYLWRYLVPPTFDQLSAGLVNVAVSLESCDG
jgi:hypothetical protein